MPADYLYIVVTKSVPHDLNLAVKLSFVYLQQIDISRARHVPAYDV